MTDTLPSTTTPADVEAEAAALTERMFGSLVEAAELQAAWLGTRLGLYQCLATHGALTPPELASCASIHARYAREWLEQQAIAGIVTVDSDGGPGGDADERRYALPAGHALALTDLDSPYSASPMALMVGGISGVLPALLDAYRTGGGVPYADYGTDFRDGQAGFNRPAFRHELATTWMEALPDVRARLATSGGGSGGGPARVADLACGAGWSAIALAAAFPGILVDGYDADDASIADARANAMAAGVDDRVTFEVRDLAGAGALGPERRYDAVFVFEALHDMAQPVPALRAAAALVADGGAVVVMDEKVPDAFTAPGTAVDRLFYAASLLHCLPVGMAEQPSAATGAVMRPATVRRYADEAGFADVEVLPIDSDIFRFYRLHR